MGKLHVCKSTVVDEIQGIKHFFFQHLSFQSYNFIHQQEHNTVDWRTFVKVQQN